MQLSGEQLKTLIAIQAENYSKRIAELTPEIERLRTQPISGSLELKQRLIYLESDLLRQQSKLAGLQELQQIIRVTEGLSEEA
jgi:hypothetical protein